MKRVHVSPRLAAVLLEHLGGARADQAAIVAAARLACVSRSFAAAARAQFAWRTGRQTDDMGATKQACVDHVVGVLSGGGSVVQGACLPFVARFHLVS